MARKGRWRVAETVDELLFVPVRGRQRQSRGVTKRERRRGGRIEGAGGGEESHKDALRLTASQGDHELGNVVLRIDVQRGLLHLVRLVLCERGPLKRICPFAAVVLVAGPDLRIVRDQLNQKRGWRGEYAPASDAPASEFRD